MEKQADAVYLDWEFEAGDGIEYSELNLLGEWVYVKVRHQGSTQEEVSLRVNFQGEVEVWIPEPMAPGWEEES